MACLGDCVWHKAHQRTSAQLCFVLHTQEAEKEKEGPVQGRLYRSLKLWSFYCDLEESLGTLESTQAVYERILDLRIATPQLILNYTLFLQVLLLELLPFLHIAAFLEAVGDCGCDNTLPCSAEGDQRLHLHVYRTDGVGSAGTQVLGGVIQGV